MTQGKLMDVKKYGFTQRKISIKLALGGLFILAAVVTATIAIGFQYHFSKQLATESAVTTYSSMSKVVNAHIHRLDSGASNIARVLAKVESSTQFKEKDKYIRAIFLEVLASNPIFYSIYIGKENDDFYQVINLASSPVVREKLNAKQEDRWVIVEVSGKDNHRIKTFSFYSDALVLREQRKAATTYYPSLRPWFLQAKHSEISKTEPYLFQHLQMTGQTYSIKVEGTNKVIGIDVALSSMAIGLINSSLGDARITKKEGFIYKKTGKLITSNIKNPFPKAQIQTVPLRLTPEEEALVKNSGKLKISNQMDWAPIDYAIAGKPEGYSIDLLNIVSEMTGLEFKYINGFSWNDVVEQYRMGKIDLLHSVLKIDKNHQFEYYSEPMYQLPISVVTKQTDIEIERLDQLNDKALAVVKNWSVIPKLKQGYPRIDIVIFDTIHEALNSVVSGRTDAVIDTTTALSYASEQYLFSDLSVHQNVSILGWKGDLKFYFTMKEENKPIINLINRAIQNISQTQRFSLEEKWNKSYHFQTEDQQKDILVPYPELIKLAQQPDLQNRLIEQNTEGQKRYFYVSPINDDEYFGVVIPSSLVFAVVNKKLYSSIFLTVIVMLILTPFVWIFSGPVVKPIKALQKETLKIKSGEYEQVNVVDSQIKEVWDLSISIDEMAKSLQEHEKSQEKFVESFIQLIAQAIDDKSPYTAGHCNRVPELGMMLAEEAEKSTQGSLSEFSFLNDDERREFRIAAWLHDCGKITTPEHIIDKGTKLEANYNRINEIRMRFEVLWRDADILYYQLAKQNPDRDIELQKQRLETQKELQDEFRFIAVANVGQEFMRDEDKQRVHDIAQKEWLRYFDDHLGLSPAEELTNPKKDETLPVKEKLLSDKSFHEIKRIRDFNIDSKFGIKMEVPELQYNLGEIYNLCITRGTLTTEDRFKINEHMISTIKMLESLPFPPELSRVPRYASTHHETLKGTGYPRKLTAEELSIPERILVLADIFEALTASDRPYKKPKTVSAAIDILHKMVLDDYIDGDVFTVFLESGIYRKYAQQYLTKEQIDKVDISRYV